MITDKKLVADMADAMFGFISAPASDLEQTSREVIAHSVLTKMLAKGYVIAKLEPHQSATIKATV